MPEGGAEHHTTGAGILTGILPAQALPWGYLSKAGPQLELRSSWVCRPGSRFTEDMEPWSNREFGPHGRLQAQLCSSNMTEVRS